MNLYDSFILGIVQGFTEFLPISSSGHLVLMEHYLGLSIHPDSLQEFDIALHAGSLIAILLYFRKTWISMLRAPLKRQKDGNPPLLLLLLAATVPIAIVGLLGAHWVEMHTRAPLFVAFGFIFTGAFLIVSSWFEARFAGRESYGWKQALGASIGQALAIFPGFSRSGITIASGRLMGLTAQSATKFAFLLGVPALGGALLHAFLTEGGALSSVGGLQLLVGLTASFVSSIAVIRFLLITIRKYGLWMWSAYLFIAAALIIADESMPLILALPDVVDQLDMRVLAGVLFMALLLESVPFTSFFVPGAFTLVVLSLFLRSDFPNLFACIPIATIGIVIGNLLSYLPARQASTQIRWKDKMDNQLIKAQHLFKKWGVLIIFFGGWCGPVRPWLSVLAGIANMRPAAYLLSMVFGSLSFVIILITGTILLGERILPLF